MGLALTGCVDPKIEPAYGIPDTRIHTGLVDEDGDGFGVSEDCDDEDEAVHPDAEETPGDGVDSNCDGSDDT
ncbi:MAG: putative metal-binding motif-containing protein [Alphaproteobacteria bacterium]|nr:putative metal-binding motif-containing protein [Alphaproteobacteria bacterium]